MGRIAPIAAFAAFLLVGCASDQPNGLAALGWGITIEQFKQRHTKVLTDEALDDQTRGLAVDVSFGGEEAVEYIVFASGRAKLIALEFYIMGDAGGPPGMPLAKCDLKVQHIAAEFEEIFGVPGISETRKNEPNSTGTILSWRTPTVRADLVKWAEPEYCGSFGAKITDGDDAWFEQLKAKHPQ